MKFFVDFDDVIFNTKDFTRIYLKEFFAVHGVDDDLFRKYYYDTNNSDGIRLFNPEWLFSCLEKNEKINTTGLRENFKRHMRDLSQFLFDDVEVFLNFAGRENTFLISFGLPDFQNKKIMACGVHEMVNGCIVTKGSKSDAIKKIIEEMRIDPEEKIVFIDDRVEFIRDIKKNFPSAVTFWLHRKEGRYCDQKNECCDYEVRDLREVREIISKL